MISSNSFPLPLLELINGRGELIGLIGLRTLRLLSLPICVTLTPRVLSHTPRGTVNRSLESEESHGYSHWAQKTPECRPWAGMPQLCPGSFPGLSSTLEDSVSPTQT